MSVQQVDQSSQLPEKYRDIVAADVQKDQAMRVGAQSLSFKQGFIFLGDTNIGQGPYPVYILAACRVNAYYDQPYNANVRTIPCCFSFFEDDNHEALATPHEKSMTPQCSKCSVCPKNVWGSTTVPGRMGKACQNAWRAIVIPAGSFNAQNQYQLFNADGLAAQAQMPVRFPVTSSKNFASYIKTCSLRDGRPKYLYITNISAAPHPTNQFEVKFEQYYKPTDEATLDMLVQLKTSAEQALVRPFELAEQPAAPIQQSQVVPQMLRF